MPIEIYEDPGPPPDEPLPPHIVAQIVVDAAITQQQLTQWQHATEEAVKTKPKKALGTHAGVMPPKAVIPGFAEPDILQAVLDAGNSVETAYGILFANEIDEFAEPEDKLWNEVFSWRIDKRNLPYLPGRTSYGGYRGIPDELPLDNSAAKILFEIAVYNLTGERAEWWNPLNSPMLDNPIIGTIASVVTGAIQRRGTQAITTAASDWALPVGDIVGAGLLVLGALETIMLLQEISQELTVEYRLKGFDEKVSTLAEHLAKLLERDVAGYPPDNKPNPERRPDKGWCNTIRRVIEEIDGTKYTQKQFNRDLEDAGFAGDSWEEITEAVKDVVEWGWCEEHWPSDFTGGSLATS